MLKNKSNIQVRWLKNENLALLFGEPVILHCNHYNLFLQRTVEDAAKYIPAVRILKTGAALSAYEMFMHLFENYPEIREAVDRFRISSEIYSLLGFGILPFDKISPDGCLIKTPVTHYSIGWNQKWGKREKPVDYFTCGYIQAALAAAYYKPPGYYQVEQTKCISMGDNINEFEASVVYDFKHIPKSQGMGVSIKDTSGRKPIKSNLDEKKITATIKSMPFVGNDDGLIPAFGVYLTRHFTNYYNYISYETARGIEESTGRKDLARDLFIEAGHICGFNTFGGIMCSDEWYGLVEPHCKTQEDWICGMTAVVNALGWGTWTVQELVPDKNLLMRIDGGYESNGYLGLYDRATAPVSYLATGASAALMNLIYLGEIDKKPELTDEFYKKLFGKKEAFVGKQTKCRAMGAESCEIVVDHTRF